MDVTIANAIGEDITGPEITKRETSFYGQPNPWPPDPLIPPEELKPIWWTLHDQSQVHAQTPFLLATGIVAASALYYLGMEEAFEPLQEIDWSPEELRAVGRGEKVCPHCAGTGKIHLLHRGAKTGVRVYLESPCPCLVHRCFWQLWGNAAIVPERFRDVRLDTLTPSMESACPMSRQSALITRLREEPTSSYLLWGPPGSGKTHFSFALFRVAASRWAENASQMHHAPQAVWRIRAASLIDEQIAWDTRSLIDDAEVRVPTVTVSMIRAAANAGLRPCLYLDELDKAGLHTEARRRRLFEVVDEVYQHKGQLVATANKSIEQMMRMQGWDGDVTGSVLRRFGGDGGITLYFGAESSGR